MTNSSESTSKGNEWKQRKLRKSPDRPKIHNMEKEIEIPHDFFPYCVHKYYLVRRRVLNRAFELSTLT